MPWRIVRNLLNNEKVINDLSNSYPIRSLARFLIRSFKTAEYQLEKKGAPISRVQSRFSSIFKEEYRKALKK